MILPGGTEHGAVILPGAAGPRGTGHGGRLWPECPYTSRRRTRGAGLGVLIGGVTQQKSRPARMRAGFGNRLAALRRERQRATLPALMHEVQTLSRFGVRPTTARTV
ncbi:hypothetical protein GCM10023324_70420 [Streptomyces youssoufiensis]